MIIIEVAGRLGRDPETRFTPNGQKLTTFSVACSIKRSGKEETVWWRITVWGERFDKVMPYLKKGSAVIVIGEMNQAPQVYTDKNGLQQVSMELTAEIIRLSPFGKPEGQEGAQQQQAANPYGAPQQAAAPTYGAAPSYGNESYGEQPSYGTPQSHAAYGAPQAQPQRGYGSFPGSGHEDSQAMDDDKLPF